MFYGTTTEKQKQKTFSQFCNEHNITGVVIQGLKTTDPYYQEVQQTSLPTVLIDMEIANPKIGIVSIDNEKAAQEAVDYLIANNHKQIGMINGSRDANVSELREQGYRASMSAHGLSINESYIQYANYEEDIAYLICKNLLENNREITALFCASDIMAIGAIRGIKDMGLSVPEDISVIGFDDIVLASYVTPELTTIAQNMERIGFEAAELLADIIGNQGKSNYRKVSPHQLKIRESVKKNK